MVMILGDVIAYWQVLPASSHCYAPKKYVMAHRYTGMLCCKLHLQSVAERGLTYGNGDVDEKRRNIH